MAGCLAIGFVIIFIVWLFNISEILGWTVLIGFVVAGFYYGKKDKEKRDNELAQKRNMMDETIARMRKNENFSISKKYLSDHNDCGIAIDENAKKISFLYMDRAYTYSYKDILESEIIEDGISVTKTSRGSQIGGALLGAVLAGGVGAIVGGLSGEKKTLDKVKNVDLKVIVNDTKNPIHKINFFKSIDPITYQETKDGEKKDSPKYKAAIENANHWQALISVLIRQADEEDKSKIQEKVEEISVAKETISSLSVADELLKLSELHKKGIISQEEFDKQKAKLLS
ncbi:SHOCT domain-containing protein [Brevibacillus agri]|uniref:SHOCT domain-containing protein n=1 Tax=Brevibacillus agri TaxID=51101 RepID=UPI003D7027C3